MLVANINFGVLASRRSAGRQRCAECVVGVVAADIGLVGYRHAGRRSRRFGRRRRWRRGAVGRDDVSVAQGRDTARGVRRQRAAADQCVAARRSVHGVSDDADPRRAAVQHHAVDDALGVDVDHRHHLFFVIVVVDVVVGRRYVSATQFHVATRRLRQRYRSIAR
jgi:hypothetical protein